MTAKPKTLLVEYAPRGDKSRTKQLRTHLTDMIKDYSELTEINLGTHLPPLMDNTTIQAYYKRNYNGETLTPEERQKLLKFDTYRDQLMNNDILILSTPLYNFGMPAPMKAWIDAVMQRGYAYTTDEQGHVPLLQHLRVCLIYTSGIIYDQINENESWNGLVAEGARLFEYMGARKVRMVEVEGVDMLEERFVRFRTENIAKIKLNDIAKQWYGVEEELNTTIISDQLYL